MSSQRTVRSLHSSKILGSRQYFKSPIKYLADFLQWQKKKNFGRYNVVTPGSVSQKRLFIPSHIPKPSYYASGSPDPLQLSLAEVKDQSAIEGMRRVCKLARKILEDVGKEASVGKTTEELNNMAHELITSADAYPSPLYYKGFPKSICTSVNNVCCHGIPDDRPLEDGDILNIDVTVYFKGYHGDCSKTFLIGNVDDYGKKLVEITELCLESAIAVCKPEAPFSLIGRVIEETAKSNGFTVLPAILGHGIGSYFHGPPEVWHVCNGYKELMQTGNTFTIEPAITQGGMELEVLEDGWTVVTADQARTAQCEHTVLITEKGAEVLT